MKKGISLPVNAVVIIALAIFVLLMLAALFGGAFPQTRQTSVATAWSKSCAKLNQYYNCRVADFDTGYDIDGDGATDTFLKVCRAYFDDPHLSDKDCRDRCCGTTTRYGMLGSICRSDSDCGEGLKCVDAKENAAAPASGEKRCCPTDKTFYNLTSHQCE